MRRKIDGEWLATAAGAGLAAVGAAARGTLLALAGALIALTAILLWIWQRHCLTGVTYRRSVGRRRAQFGETVVVETELVNDKALPLTWLYIKDEIPAEMTVEGGTVIPGVGGLPAELHIVTPMLPYQRIRRRLTVVCDRRGEHKFGPTEVRSGNPVGYRQRWVQVKDQEQLLVYPKVFRLNMPAPASLIPLGESRARFSLATDPSRVVGVRDYRPGDPLRHIDWRATARSRDPLVRIFEPAATIQAAVFADLRRPAVPDASDVIEFTVAVTASIVTHLSGSGIATGLYAAGSASGRPIAFPISSAPTALASMMELLAKAYSYSRSSLGAVMLGQQARFRGGTSVLVVSADFSRSTMAAIAEMRRAAVVTAVWVATERGRPPAAGLVDAHWEVKYDQGWQQRGALELAS